MQMNMENRLTSVPSVVDHHSITALIKPFLCCDGLCYEKEMANDLPVRNCYPMNISNMFFGNDQHVNRRLGIQILERQGMLVLVDDPCGDLFFYDLAKNALLIKVHLFLLVAMKNNPKATEPNVPMINGIFQEPGICL